MRRDLFDVILSSAGDDSTGEVFISVTIVGRYGRHDGEIIAERADFPKLDDALEFARGAVIAFMRGTQA